MDTTKIFLERMKAKDSADTSGGLNVNLSGNRKLLPLNDVSEVISLMEQYTEERDKCNKIRLTCQVNPICSNVLFNRVSEIVKYEGSSAVTFLNYGVSGNTDMDPKEESKWNPFKGNEKKQVIYKPDTLSFWSGGSMRYQGIDSRLASTDPDTYLTNVDRTTIEPNSSPSAVGEHHPTNAIRDMQLSRTDKAKENEDHFVYHCGLDIFNNHLIRSNTFKCICKMPEGWDTKEVTEDDYTAFNTIADLMRDSKGEKVIEKLCFPITANIQGHTKFLALHTYLYDDILTFNEAVKTRLIEKYNGWLGFLNKSKIKTYSNFVQNEELYIERPIMYMSGGDFVDMYPGRDLYSFVPKYNKHRNRMEKNWNYCITYPSSSTTEGFDDIINQYNGALKAVYFDENTRADSGAMQLVIYSKAKHGLSEGDTVNIYKTYKEDKKTVNELVVANAKVDVVVDPFIFTTFTQGVSISSQWVGIKKEDKISGFTVDGTTYTIATDGSQKYFMDDEYNRYYIVNSDNDTDDSDGIVGYVNIDVDAQEISYKKVVNGIECDYYVRIFSRLPNFKFASGDTSNEYNIYRPYPDGKNMVEKYQQPEYPFESHVSRLAFAKNIYSDDIGEIVFTDDIDISDLHDNLGRPLTDLYITFVKNNAGYKEWYGFDETAVDINSPNVEFSHCFGRITCGFEMSDESIYDGYSNNIKLIHNVDSTIKGYAAGEINGREYDTEISFDKDVNFYGDLCYYDNYNAIERSIQPMLHRFNTAQRESSLATNGGYFATMIYDDIARDDYDSDPFRISQTTINGCNNRPEGYYYNPHYRIRIKSFGKLNTAMPQFLNIQSVVNLGNRLKITTQEYHFLTPGDKSIIYNMETDKYYYLTTISGENASSRVFYCTVVDENGVESNSAVDGYYLGDYKLFKIDNFGFPSYAHLLKDGTCRYIWRNVVNNGSMDSEKELEVYPFTNGAFYINKSVSIFVRRQDPDDVYGLYSDDDAFGVEPTEEEFNNYTTEDEIKC